MAQDSGSCGVAAVHDVGAQDVLDAALDRRAARPSSPRTPARVRLPIYSERQQIDGLRGSAGNAKLAPMQRAVLFMFLATACGDASSNSEATDGGDGGATTTEGGDGGPTTTGGGDGGETCVPHTNSDEPDFSPPAGSFKLRSQDGFATFEGSMLSGAPLSFHTEDARQGSCRLLTYEPSNCQPGCDPGASCIDAQCAEAPTLLDAGDLTITEFLADPIHPTGGGSYYWASESIGDPGARATLTGTGGEVGPFELSVCVPEPVVPAKDWSQMMTDRGPGEDVTLTWNNAVPGARVYLHMTTGIGTHGGISPVEVECEGPDSGALTLPGAYLDQLYAPGSWSCGECGDNQLKRYFAADAPVAPGKLRFRAEAWTGLYFHP